MARQFSFTYQLPSRRLLPSAADAAGRTSPYASLKDALKAFIKVGVNQGNAAPVTFSLLQAQDVLGTGSKAVTGLMPGWLVPDTSLTDVPASQALAATFASGATLTDKSFIWDIIPENIFDIPNGFHCLALVTSASNAGNITSGDLFFVPAYAGASQPSTFVT
jgi:hypothetical protein